MSGKILKKERGRYWLSAVHLQLAVKFFQKKYNTVMACFAATSEAMGQGRDMGLYLFSFC